MKDRYKIVHWTAGDISDVVQHIQIDVNDYMDEGYELAGPLLHWTTDNPDLEEWHIMVQPMVWKGKNAGS